MSAYGDRIMETTTTTGTGPLTLLGAVSGFRSFGTAFGSAGQIVGYTIEGTSPAEWETGYGTVSSGTLYRDVKVTASSNGNALVAFSSGTKAVWCDLPSEGAIDAGTSLAFRNLAFTPF